MNTFTPHRRWFRFSLRTLFVALTLACVAFAWTAYALNWIRARHEILGKGLATPTYQHYLLLRERPAVAPGCLWVFGEEGIHHLSINPYSSEPSHDEIRRLF